MDVNGTRFHLFHGRDDWAYCFEDDVNDSKHNSVCWNRHSNSIQLKPVLARFPRSQRDVVLDPRTVRRGSDVDRFGNWYWISHDRQCLYWQPSGTKKPELFWKPSTPPAPTKSAGAFVPIVPKKPLMPDLAGLAVTKHHYLVVGSVNQHGVYLFDLHAGGEPTLFQFPKGVDFEPIDITAAPNGGVWILGRKNQDQGQHVYWGLNDKFEIISESSPMQTIEDEALSDFKPIGGDSVIQPKNTFPAGYPVAAISPVSIVGLPDSSVLILDSPKDAEVSHLYHYRLNQQLADPIPLQGDLNVTEIGEKKVEKTVSVIAHDIAYLPKLNRLVAVEQNGNQAIAFNLNIKTTPISLSVAADYLPLHFFGGRALVYDEQTGNVFYDVVGTTPDNDDAVRWLQVRTLDQPRFLTQATLLTPVLDGRERDCVWHRLFLEACIPSESAVTILTRSHNDRELINSISFSREPDLYLRQAGSEIPLHQPFAGQSTVDNRTGTWELLFQQAHGRYLQIKIEFAGNGRVTPQLFTLRAYYPRFSYPRHYLPSVFLREQSSASFIERMLANMEGIYTEIEGRIATAHSFFDPRSTPPEALEWLAGWLGFMMDPMWAKVQETHAETGAKQSSQDESKRVDRRRLFIRFARILYKRRGTVKGIQFALHLFLDPCLEQILQYFKEASVTPDSPVTAHLAYFGLPAPTPATTESAFEELLYAYVLKRPSTIRIIESFQEQKASGQDENNDDVAHRFSVLIPENLSSEQMKMVNHIVNLEKPAHTAFTIQRYLDGFRVGLAKVGIDTTLAHTSGYRQFMLGRDHLAEGFLPAAYPMNVNERLVSDRDQLGYLPSL